MNSKNSRKYQIEVLWLQTTYNVKLFVWIQETCLKLTLVLHTSRWERLEKRQQKSRILSLHCFAFFPQNWWPLASWKIFPVTSSSFICKQESLTRNTTYRILVLYAGISWNSNIRRTELGILKRGESQIPIHSYTTTELLTDLLMLFGEQKCMKYYFSSDLPLRYYPKTFRRVCFRLLKMSFSWKEMVHCNWCVASQIPTQS